MKKRILTHWSLPRALFLIMGIMVIVPSVLNHEWFGVLFGVYFASMGLFALGCASGSCFGGNCTTETKEKSKIIFEQVKCKEAKSK